MKKYYRFVLAAFAIVAAASCSKEFSPVESATDVAKESRTFVASLDNTTKAVLSDGLEVLWQETDQVAVFDDLGGRNVFTVASGAGTTSAVLTGNVTAGATKFTAVFPASAAVEMGVDGSVEVSVPSVQNITAGAVVDPAALVETGYTETAEMALKNVVSLAKFTVDASAGVEIVSISGNANESCSGSVSVAAATGVGSGADSPVVSVNVPAEGGSFYACVVPVNFSNGLTVTCTKEGSVGSKVSANPASFVRSAGLNLGSVVPTTWLSNMITDGPELKEFSENASKYGAGAVVTVANDIDLSGIVLDASKVCSFAGILEGAGHALKNWTCTCAIVETLEKTGVIRNLVVDATSAITLPSAPSATSFGAVVNVNKGLVSNVVNNAPATQNLTAPISTVYGVIVGYTKEGGRLENVVNNGDLTVTSVANTAGTVYYGTVCGRTDGAGTSTVACKNNGAVTITFTAESSKNHYIGGVIGSATNGAAITGCENTGNVTVNTTSQAAALLIGGICPYASGITKDCINRGNVSFISESMVKASPLAGICAYQDGTKGGMLNCTNYGDVTLEAGYLGGRNSVGGFDGTKSYSTMHATTAGICAYAYKCSFMKCDNYGKIRFVFDDLLNSLSTFSGRAHAAGIVGNSWGKIEECSNYGSIYLENVAADRADIGDKNVMPVVGGITGGDYASAKDTQNETDIVNCTNEGSITIVCDGYKSNCAYGGIVGWPCKEAASIRVIDGCVNKGDITVSGAGKCRCGGINGGTGAVRNCTNYGKIKVTGQAESSAVGGVSGFSTYNHTFENNANYGDVESDIKFSYGMGGLIGNVGNTVNATIGAGCKVNCSVTNTNATATQVGMVVGYFSGTTKTVTIGTDASPVKVKGTYTIGGTATTLTEDNYSQYLVGPKNFTSGVHTIKAAYGE